MPRSTPLRYSPIVWPQTKVILLSWTARLPESNLQSLLAKRQTRRSFGRISLTALAGLLQTVQAVGSVSGGPYGITTSHRPTPSAGAIHPVHLVVTVPTFDGWHRYDPFRHALVSFESRIDPLEVLRHATQFVDPQEGSLVMLIAEPGMTYAKYLNAASLVWRDAGVLLGYLSLAAEAMGLAFCPLGATGEPWASTLIDQAGLQGVGLALVGSVVS